MNGGVFFVVPSKFAFFQGFSSLFCDDSSNNSSITSSGKVVLELMVTKYLCIFSLYFGFMFPYCRPSPTLTSFLLLFLLSLLPPSPPFLFSPPPVPRRTSQLSSATPSFSLTTLYHSSPSSSSFSFCSSASSSSSSSSTLHQHYTHAT